MDRFSKYQYHIDLHVHTNRYSPCAESLDPEMIPGYMREHNLHGVVIAEHDTLWSQSDMDRLNHGLKNARIYRGVEVTSSSGHFVVIGMDQLNGIELGIPTARMIELAHHCNAAVILAHHHRACSAMSLPVEVLTLPEGIDAIEVTSTMTRGQDTTDARRYAEIKNWHTVAGNDAHHINNIGEAFTAFETLPADGKKLAEAVRNGLGVPIRLKKN